MLSRKTERIGGQRTPLLFSTPFLISMFAFIVLPFILTLAVSMTNLNLQRLANLGKGIVFTGLDNYMAIWDNGRIVKMVSRTFIWMLGSLFGGITLGVFYAMVMSFNIKGKSFLKAVILMPWVLPSAVTGYVTKQMVMSGQGVLWSLMVKAGIIARDAPMLSDSTIAMVIVICANVWRAAPYVAIMVYGKVKSLPQSHIEAAKIDGANALQSFIYITIPWIWSIVKRCGILLFIWSFNAYELILTLTNGGPANATTILPIALRNMAFGQYSFGKGAAYGVFILVLLVVTKKLAEMIGNGASKFAQRRKYQV